MENTKGDRRQAKGGIAQGDGWQSMWLKLVSWGNQMAFWTIYRGAEKRASGGKSRLTIPKCLLWVVVADLAPTMGEIVNNF